MPNGVAYRLSADSFKMMLNPFVNLIGVGSRLFAVDVLELDVAFRIGKHVGNRTSDRQKPVLSVTVDEILQSSGHDPEVVRG